MIKVSLDWIGCYLEHKEYFNEMAKALQAAGSQVGIITGERESKRAEIEKTLGFKPDFLILWANDETVVNAAVWKVQKMIDNDITVHYDDDARDMKRFTDRWVIKTMKSDDVNKF